MTEARIDWDALRRTEGELPWEAVEGAVAVVVAEPARWKEIADAYHDTLEEEDAEDCLELYIAVILGLAAAKLSVEENQSTCDLITDFLLEKIDNAALCGYEILEEDLRDAAGRIGPSILPKVLQRIDALAFEEMDDEGYREDDLSCLLPLAAKSTDIGMQEQVAQRCMARLERVLDNKLEADEAFQPMDVLAALRWKPAAELMDRLGREKENELQAAWLWGDYEECNPRVHGIEPPEDYPEWWDCEPREYLEKRCGVWRINSQDGDESDDADDLDGHEVALKRVAQWAEQFAASSFVAALPEDMREGAGGDVAMILRYGVDYLGADVAAWSFANWKELLLEILPRKVTSEPVWFATVAPLAAALLRWLEEQGHVKYGSVLAADVEKWGPQIEAAAYDPSNWGMAKSIAMQAYAEGVEPGNQEQLAAFMLRYNERLAAGREVNENSYAQADKQWVDDQPYVREDPKVGRNDPCPCGSGKKFKKCCGR